MMTARRHPLWPPGKPLYGNMAYGTKKRKRRRKKRANDSSNDASVDDNKNTPDSSAVAKSDKVKSAVQHFLQCCILLDYVETLAMCFSSRNYKT
eukprot:scaffold74416_cov41-Cyclotella_meneghiniana.AAC.5